MKAILSLIQSIPLIIKSIGGIITYLQEYFEKKRIEKAKKEIDEAIKLEDKKEAARRLNDVFRNK